MSSGKFFHKCAFRNVKYILFINFFKQDGTTQRRVELKKRCHHQQESLRM